MSEYGPTTSTTPSTEGVSRVDLATMNGIDHGFRISNEGKGHGGVFVGKEKAGELAQTYFHADELRSAMEAQGLSGEQVAAIFASAGDKTRLHINEMPNGRSKYGNDRTVAVYDAQQNKIGGGAEFHGKTEAKHSAGEYVDVDLNAIINVEAAIEELEEAGTVDAEPTESIQLETKEASEAQAERQVPKRRILKALTAAALIGISVFGPSPVVDAGSTHQEASKAQISTVSEGAQSFHVPDTVVTPDIQRDNYRVESTVSPSDWMINPGDGGDVLFTHVGIDVGKWNQIAPQLYEQYKDTGYFYKTETGDVRFSYPGEVPQNIQQTIESLVAAAK